MYDTRVNSLFTRLALRQKSAVMRYGEVIDFFMLRQALEVSWLRYEAGPGFAGCHSVWSYHILDKEKSLTLRKLMGT